jgi:hypothetical protein
MKNEPLREAILSLLHKRRSGATICPSEAARTVYPEHWRDHMEATRREALALVDEGVIDICQDGQAVDPTKAIKGPIRLRLKFDDHDPKH